MQDPRPILVFALIAVVGAIILSATWGEEQEIEKYYEYQPYTYEISFINAEQVKPNFFSRERTRVQYVVTNNESQEGKFTLNLVFNNDKEIEDKSEKITVPAREKTAITIDSPLSGISTFELNVIPPDKKVQKERTITKKISGWQYLLRWITFFK